MKFRASKHPVDVCLGVGIAIALIFSSCSEQKKEMKDQEDDQWLVEKPEINQKFTDGDLSIEYKLGVENKFVNINVYYKNIAVSRFTRMSRGEMRFYGDPRTGIAVSIQFSREGVLQGLNLTGVEFEYQKNYRWDDVKLEFTPIKME